MSRKGDCRHIAGMPKPLISGLAVLTVSIAAAASPAFGQPHGHVGVLTGISRIDADFSEGTQAASGVFGSAIVLDWLDIEGEVIIARGDVVRQYTGTSVSFAPGGSTRDEVERLAVVTRFTNTRQTESIASIAAAFHPRDTGGRVQPRLLLGIASHRIRDRRSVEHLSLPVGVTLEQVNRMMPAEEIHRRQIGGVSLGADVIIRMTGRFAVAPAVRYDYMSIGDEINNALRSSMRLMWRF